MILKKEIKDFKGSLTLEAALVLPVFIYAVIAFIFFLQIIFVQEILQEAITQTGFFSVKYAYVYDYIRQQGDRKEEKAKDLGTDNKNLEEKSAEEKSAEEKSAEEKATRDKLTSPEAIIAHGIDSAFYKYKLGEYLDLDIINNSCIENGFDGINMYLSSYMTEEDEVDIILFYYVKPTVVFFDIGKLPMMQRVRMRGWSGYRVERGDMDDPEKEEEDKEEIVFITETGTVYHTSKACSYLALTIKEKSYDNIEGLRNLGGGRYSLCELCGNRENPTTKDRVYITDYGDRYHWELNCSGLKRTIIEIPLKEVGNRNLCSKCKVK